MSELNDWKLKYQGGSPREREPNPGELYVQSPSRPDKYRIPLDQVSHKKLLTSQQTSEVLNRSENTLSNWRQNRRKWRKLSGERKRLYGAEKGPTYIKVKKSGVMRVSYRMSDLISWVEIRHIRTIRRGLERIDFVLEKQVARLNALRLRQKSSCDEVFHKLQNITRTLVPPTDARYPDQVEWDALDFEECT
tara:strand:+ start:320 stop:895 length:576 start_codon:yes stop_codon:yes gene_type:complete